MVYLRALTRLRYRDPPGCMDRLKVGRKLCTDPVRVCLCYKGDDVAMSETVAEDIKRWTAKRKSALVIEIIQGKTTVAAASRTYDLAPSEIEGWVEDARKGMENALKANPLDVRQQYEKQLKDLQEAYGEAMLVACPHRVVRSNC
ncbi:MAG: DUF1153 domain-containing protein [Pseudomonadota bacterium]